jgi:O-antigen/teichoic acid export membrane protein
MGVALIATPFTIRLLGSEGYGVLILIGLIPTYFAFADFGMSIASTKFASEAYGEGDLVKEGEIVRTAALIALITSVICAGPIFLLSSWIVNQFNVPEAYRSSASIGLKITSFSFVLGILSSVVNTPMLTRLRMDLNTSTVAGPKILLAVATPAILYFGGGIIGAISWVLVIAVVTNAVVIFFSGRLLPQLFETQINRTYIGPLLKFGGAWFVAIVAGILIGNLEKFILTSLVSVRALAYYSIAFTFANIATLFSQAMLQSMLPAFSQMMSIDRRQELNSLFSRGIRLAAVGLLPFVVFLFVIGRPFLTIWAGEEFGNAGTLPFYILLCGFSLSIFSVLPYSVLLAAGRTDYFAKMYWIELPFYAVAAWFLVGRFEIVGAAMAYALRTIFDGIWAIVLCNHTIGLRYGVREYAVPFLCGMLIFTPLMIYALLDNLSPMLLILALASYGLYSLLAWSKLLDINERRWILSRLGRAAC